MAAPLFFANGAVFTSAVKRAVTGADQPVHHVVIDMEAVTDIDVTGAEAFESLEHWLRDHDVTLAFSRVRPPTRARLEELGLLADQAFFATNRAAVTALADRDEKPQD
jgi:SulP family sulfate permease